MNILSLLLGFAPFILFGILAGSSFTQLEIAIVVCLVASIVIGYKDLRRGFILTWGTLIFFVFLLVSVVLMKNVFVMTHVSLLLNGTLAAITWISLIVGKPFTEQYARLEVDKSRWDNPIFIKINRQMTAVWGCIFLWSLILSFFVTDDIISKPTSSVLQYGVTLLGILFNVYYPNMVRKKYAKYAQDEPKAVN
jgi:hypothetical protein